MICESRFISIIQVIMSNIRTRTGDFGETDLKDQRVKKTSDIIELLGDIDEAMAHFILCHNLRPENEVGFKDKVSDLITISAIIAGYQDIETFTNQKILDLEAEIVELGDTMFDFTYPFDDLFKAHINVLRTVVRRAERQAYRVLVDDQYKVIKTYLNALSDYVFTFMK